MSYKKIYFLLIAIFIFQGAMAYNVPAFAEDAKIFKIGVIGMAGGAYEAMKSFEVELGVSVTQLAAPKFRETPLPDLSGFDIIYAMFADKDMTEQYRQCISGARKVNPSLKVFAVGPPPVCKSWVEQLGPENVGFDPKMAQYYGLSNESMKNMIVYTLVTFFNRPGVVAQPDESKAIKIYHPEHKDIENLDSFLAASKKSGWDVEKCPRVVIGAWRHHCLFHQPKVIDALVAELKKLGILAVCLIADDPGFRERVVKFKPDVVVMTSHTNEPAQFWEKIGVARIHTLWFMDESIDEWKASVESGMSKSELQHLYVFAEARGATECLTAGGTKSGKNSGEEILPVPDRIARIAGRVNAWITLKRSENSVKKIAIMTYDREVDKSGLMNGPLHDLNAPRSMVRFLGALKKAGYGIDRLPVDESELLSWMMDHGRQMGAWEPAPLARLVSSGKAVMIPEEDYVKWFEKKVPAGRRAEVEKYWGAAPGKIMVFEKGGKKYLVLPKIDFGNVVLMAQPPKGEALTASTSKKDVEENLLPPTHHYLATYFWLHEGFKANAVIHFGSHGSEWLFPGKQAVLCESDWSDILIGNMPNINPWLSDNIAELIPCKRRAMAVAVDYLPPLLMNTGLSDELINLESAIKKWDALEPGALKKKFAVDITVEAKKCRLDAELKLSPPQDSALSGGDIEKIASYLHELKEEFVPASMHVLGEIPPDVTLLPYLAHCMGKKYYKAAKEIFQVPAGATEEDHLKKKGAEALELVLRKSMPPSDAIKACGGILPAGTISCELKECFDIAVEMDAGIKKTGQEIDNVLAALNGKFIPPGPSGSPERNPGVVPTGRNMFVLNPEELPARSSWDLGKKLIDDYLKNELAAKGRYPKKVAFSLIPFATYSDYGIIESQIMYLMGTRPVWDSKNRVKEIELIPAAELGRPRIDVFLSVRSIYRDELPEMMKLLDKAARMAAAADEKDNYVYQNSLLTRKQLEKKGVSNERSLILSRARMFGAEPKEVIDGHNWFFYLAERSGEWENRRDLLDVYLKYCKNVYTEGAWGDSAPEAFDAAIMDTELILRSWYDGRDFVLTNKFTWWADGMLSMAVKEITGKEPGYMFVDVRDKDEASIVDSTDMLQKDLRLRVMNSKWIREMMKEGYAGANAISKNFDNLMGWKITRESSVSDANWEEVYDVYVRDSRKLDVRKWMDRENPHAFQKMTGTLIETMRKKFWTPSPEVALDIAAAYADSVVRHGLNGGVREGGNEKLAGYVGQALALSKSPGHAELLNQFQGKVAENTMAPGSEQVRGKKLVEQKKDIEFEHNGDEALMLIALGLFGLLVLLAGYKKGPSVLK